MRPSASARTLLRSADAAARVARARDWLVGRAPAEEVLVVAATSDAAKDLLREAALEQGAAFGWHRVTLGRLAAALATPALVRRGLAPVGPLAAEAVVARVLHALRRADLGRYGPALGGPGLPRALAHTLAELRLADVDLAAPDPAVPELRAIAGAYDAELGRAGLADRAAVLALAADAARDRTTRHPLLGLPTLLLDVAVASAAERGLVAALAGRAPEMLATLPAGDAVSARHLAAALDAKPEDLDPVAPSPSLRRLQAHLFEETAPRPLPAEDDAVSILSAPGEGRECVEIARRVLRLAARGVPFDRMAVLLRSPEEYRPHLEEALGRAAIPAHFARGAVRPDSTGRAFVALLACAAEGLSARRFAEYLSLGEVPDATAEGAPPPPLPSPQHWVAPDEELVPAVVAAALAEGVRLEAEPATASASGRIAGPDPSTADPDVHPVAAGTLRAPHRWERLLVDAAVVGGRARWARRLDGLAHERRLDLEALEDPDEPAGERIRRELADLARLRAFALPLVDALAALPEQAVWGAWLEALGALATRTLRRPERVLSVLAELAPMGAVGPVTLEEVQLVLARRLLELAVPPAASRYGRVFVAPADAARGLVFDVVFVPGLAERLFPRKIQEDPILLDAERVRLGRGLVTNEARLAHERLALRIAVGAARSRLVLSYPRLDLDQSRPRVPSFYALEALRAAEGRLPGFDELAQRAETLAEARVGWPAPARAEEAIDEAEHDLALLEGLLRLDPERCVGTARYLLTANPHLGRALRFRARRWLRRWTVADGLVEPSEAARVAIRAHGLDARAYSPTALQQYAACPYKFLLYAVHRLAPREVPEAIEEIDALQRGALVHEVQFALFEQLRDAELLPVTELNLTHARELLDGALDRVAARFRDQLAPAIERVWADGVESIRADLREWLRRASEDGSGFVPWRFELGFGLPPGVRGRRAADPHSTSEPVALDCGIRLRGSIDLVERRRGARGSPASQAAGALRATDHKTGRDRVPAGAVVAGGQSLQPVLYSLALERLCPDAEVEAGRLYYCTATGGFEERNVPLDAAARESAWAVAEIVGGALSQPFLPAAPARGACDRCDYRVVCGPYEELRTSRKPSARLDPLARLRELP